MTRRRRRVTLVAAVVAAAVTAAAAFLTLPTASADVTTQYYATGLNGSDPEMIFCEHPGYGSGYCLATSQDLNQPGIYPMERTKVYFSKDGVYWIASDTAIREYDLAGAGAAQAQHLWAPALIAGWGGDNANYYLYTPALTNGSDKLSSRIFVSRSTNPLSGYANNVLGQVTGAPAGLYMSDPFVFREFRTASSPHYLIWADGDASTCGGISMRRMTSATTIEPFSQASQATVTINGLGVLGNCGGKGRPYLEGASLYQFDRWNIRASNNPKGGLPGKYTLVFAAKPTSTPAECAAPGQPNTANEVIAYATSNTVTGPYTYQGILMCGSSSEWTNQASIVEVKAANGEWRLMMVYHDGRPLQNNTRSRFLHSECLYTMDNKFVPVMRTGEGAVNNSQRQWCLNAESVVAIRSYQNGQYVRSDSNGVMVANRSIPGTWEQFALTQTPTVDYLNAHNPIGKYVQANRGNGTIMARGNAIGEWEKFVLVKISNIANGIRVGIKDSEGKWVRVDSTGKLVIGPVSSGIPNHDSYYFDVLFLST